MEKPFVPPEERREVAPRDDVRAAASPVRCPFCHEDVAPEGHDWVACRTCLARHHEGCWRESKRCASCGADEAILGSVTIGPPASLRGAVLVAILVTVLVAGLATIALLPGADRTAAATRVANEVLRVRIALPASGGALAALRRAVDVRLRRHFEGTGVEGSTMMDPVHGEVHVAASRPLDAKERRALERALTMRGELRAHFVTREGEPGTPVPERGREVRWVLSPEPAVAPAEVEAVYAARDELRRPAALVHVAAAAAARVAPRRGDGRAIVLVLDDEVVTTLTPRDDAGVELLGTLSPEELHALLATQLDGARYPGPVYVVPTPR